MTQPMVMMRDETGFGTSVKNNKIRDRINAGSIMARQTRTILLLKLKSNPSFKVIILSFYD